MADPPAGVRDPAHRIEMRCDSCGQFGTHPLHQTIVDMARGIVVNRHFDCCHYAGCPDGSCTRALSASGNAHGDGLTAWLHGGDRG